MQQFFYYYLNHTYPIDFQIGTEDNNGKFAFYKDFPEIPMEQWTTFPKFVHKMNIFFSFQYVR